MPSCTILGVRKLVLRRQGATKVTNRLKKNVVIWYTHECVKTP